jgi:hypothetical protein
MEEGRKSPANYKGNKSNAPTVKSHFARMEDMVLIKI